ncbi:hypothetical protein [Vibrio phage vB_VpM-pA2SJ1]|uniref:Uncharacterized protein n=1 Tax=Vibrio phage vB_VpM-pA2SJ1 TaxID=3095964 RepID=A0AAX4J5F0_9CAUD
MIDRDILKVTQAKAVWTVVIPESATKGRPLAAYDANGNSIDWDSWDFDQATRTLNVRFGVDPVAGELEYEFQLPSSGECDNHHHHPMVSIQNNEGGVTFNQRMFH